MKKLLVLDALLVHAACVALAVMLWGPKEQPHAQPEVLQAGRFRIVDIAGDERGHFAATPDGAELVVLSNAGREVVRVSASAEAGQIVLTTDQGEVLLEAKENASRVRLGSGASKAELSSSLDGNALMLESPERRIRLSTNPTEEALVIEDPSGSAPRLALSTAADTSLLAVEGQKNQILRASVTQDAVELAVGYGAETVCWRVTEAGAGPCLQSRRSQETLQ